MTPLHAMFDLTRTSAAPGLHERLDRLARMRAASADNEVCFEAGDLGRISAIAALPRPRSRNTSSCSAKSSTPPKHLRRWMAPQRVPTALQFMPAKNRLIPQPLGVVGIIAPWNYPLQLTLAPAVARARRRQPGDDQAERTRAAIFRAAAGGDRGQIRRRPKSR